MTSSRILRLISLFFLAWLLFVAVTDIRLGEWWRYAETLELAAARLRTGEWHGENLIHHLKCITFWIILLIAAYRIGTLAVKYCLPPSNGGGERLIITLLLGMTGTGLVVFFLGIAGLWGWPTLLMLSLACLLGLISIVGGRRENANALRSCSLSPVNIVLSFIGLIALLLIVLYALSPPVQSDALRYHLAAPDRWRQIGRIVYLPHYAHSNMPLLVEMNFALALMARLPAAAQIVHVTYLILAAAMLILIGRQWQGEGSRAPLAASVLLLTHPIAGPVSAWPNVDLASLAYLLAMAWATVCWLERPSRRLLVLAGVMGGSAFACKYTNLLPAAFVGAVVLLSSDRNESFSRRVFGGVKNAAIFSFLVVLVCSPWLIRNAITTGNPVYPLAYSIFGGDDWSEENAKFYSAKAAEKGTARAIEQEKVREASRRGIAFAPNPLANESTLSRLQRLTLIPWNTYRWPGAFESSPQGPLMLLAFPMFLVCTILLFFRKSTLAGYFYSTFLLFLLASWAATYQSNRFLLPVPALLAVYLAVWAGGKSAVRAPAAAAIAFLLITQSSWLFQFILLEPHGAMRYSLGKESKSAYLSRNINYYDAAQWLNANVTDGKGVFLLGEHRTFYFDVPVLGADWFDTPSLIRLYQDAQGEDPIDFLHRQNISHVYLNADELLAGPYLPLIRQTLEEAPESARHEWLLGVLEQGPRAIRPEAPLPGMGSSNYDYFLNRVGPRLWQEWVSLMRSDRMESVYRPSPLSIVYELEK